MARGVDEADRMLDMGFVHDVKKVLARLPAKRQNLLFSATFSKDITDLAGKLLHNPERIEVTPPNTTVERIEQRVFRLAASHKRALLAHLITTGAWEQVLVFTRTKHGANRLAEYLDKHGLSAAAIHGNKSQNARTKALADFKAGEIRILVATDIAARGLDIDQLPHVVNFELPNVDEDYVHRIGRTGRAGRSGEAISLVAPDEEKLLKSIERMTRQKIADGDLVATWWALTPVPWKPKNRKCASVRKAAIRAMPAPLGVSRTRAAAVVARTRVRTRAVRKRKNRRAAVVANVRPASRNHVTHNHAKCHARPRTVIRKSSWMMMWTTSAIASTTCHQQRQRTRAVVAVQAPPPRVPHVAAAVVRPKVARIASAAIMARAPALGPEQALARQNAMAATARATASHAAMIRAAAVRHGTSNRPVRNRP